MSSAFAEALVARGVTAVFGNPGTTELPLVEAIGSRAQLTYYLCLHEGVATGMAAGYAIATGKAGVSLLHVAPGIANGLANCYNAFRNKVPLVVVSGQQDRRHQFLGPVLYGDLVAMMRPVTKWAWEAQTAQEVPAGLDRAIREALAPAQAPTFLSIPLDLQTESLPVASGAVPPTLPRGEMGGAAPQAGIEAAIALLHSAASPAIIAGDLIGATRSARQLRDLANELGAAAYWEPVSTYANYPTTDPMFAGVIFPNAKNFEEVFAKHDVILACGLGLTAPALYGGTRWTTAANRVIHLTDDSRAVAGVDVDLTLLGAPAATLAALSAEHGRRVSDDLAAAISERRATLAAQWSASRDRLRRSAAKRAQDVPVSPAALLAAIYDKLPEGTSVVDESLSNSTWVQLMGQFGEELDYIGGTKGGGIGFGMPAALGVAVGNPGRSVVAIIGDGSALYSIQALWTAAKYRIPVVFCILNNASYRILKGGLMSLTGISPEEVGAVPGLDITQPEIDFVSLSQSFGVAAARASTIDDALQAILDAIASGAPRLIDIQVDRSVRKIFS